MKNMRKLVPAFAMLMVAAIMMSTASFAWFSMNTSATATGMHVMAKSEGGLAIASYTGTVASPVAPSSTSYGPSATMSCTNGATAVAPTSHSGSKWYYATSSAINSPEAVAGTNGMKYTAVGADAGASYYLQSKWSIKTLDDTNAYNISISSITVGNTTDTGDDTATQGLQANLAKSLRVAVNAQGKWYYFAPAYGSGTTLYYVEDPATDGEDAVRTAYASSESAEKIVYGASTLTQVVLTGVTTAGADLDIYIYFEGEDDNCISANAVALKDITVEIAFAAAKVTP